MGKKSKIKTPDWILEGYDSKEEYEKDKGIDKKKEESKKKFIYRECPKCGSDKVSVAIGEKKAGMWECNNCDWKGKDIIKKEMGEEEFMKYLDEKGEEVS